MIATTARYCKCGDELASHEATRCERCVPGLSRDNLESEVLRLHATIRRTGPVVTELVSAVRTAQACWQPEYEGHEAPYARLTKAADDVEAIVGKVVSP